MINLPHQLILLICSYFKTTHIYNILSITSKCLKTIIYNNIEINDVFYMQILRKLYLLYSKFKNPLVFCYGGLPRDLILKVEPSDGDYLVFFSIDDKDSNDIKIKTLSIIYDLLKQVIPGMFNPIVHTSSYVKQKTNLMIKYDTGKKNHSIDITFNVNFNNTPQNEMFMTNLNLSVDFDINSLAYMYKGITPVNIAHVDIPNTDMSIVLTGCPSIVSPFIQINNIINNIKKKKCNINLKLLDYKNNNQIDIIQKNNCGKRITKMVNKQFNIINMTFIEIKNEYDDHQLLILSNELINKKYNYYTRYLRDFLYMYEMEKRAKFYFLNKEKYQ
jgi:hypothetical protein